MKTLHRQTTKHHNIRVVQHYPVRTLLSGTGFCQEQGAINIEDLHEHIFDYSLLAMRGLEFMPFPRRILVIGLGGGIIPRELRHVLPNSEIDIIEIDEDIINIAKDYFFFKEDDKMKVHKGDAFVITQEMTETYDMIVVDAFTENYTPFPLMSVEFVQRLYDIASGNAILTVNSSSCHPSFTSQVKTYRSVFGDGIYSINGDKNEFSTTIYVTKGNLECPTGIDVTEDTENGKIFSLYNP